MKIRKLAKKYICFFSALSMIIPCFEVKAQGGMKASQDCIDLIKEAEGFSRYKYWDYSQWTIGYGTGVDVIIRTELQRRKPKIFLHSRL